MSQDKPASLPQGAEVYLFAGVVSGLSLAVIADVWHGFMVNLWAHRASYVLFFGGLFFFWAVVQRHWKVLDGRATGKAESGVAPQEEGDYVRGSGSDELASNRSRKVSLDCRV